MLYLKEITTGFYVAKLQEIGYQVCFSSWRDVYETIQNPEFRNPAIGGVSENVRFFYVKSRESRYLENGTSDHRNEKTKTLCNTKYPPKPRKTHLRNHFWPLESGFSAIATYKTYVFSKSSNVPILKFFLVIPDTFPIPKSLTEVMGDFFSLKTRSRPM